MPIAKNLVGIGFAGPQAQTIVGSVDNNVTATGSSSQANSYGIRTSHTVVTTTGANTGVRLPSGASAGDNGTILNNGASTLFVYPPSGGAINAGTTDAKADVATLKGAFWVAHGNGNYTLIVGA